MSLRIQPVRKTVGKPESRSVRRIRISVVGDRLEALGPKPNWWKRIVGAASISLLVHALVLFGLSWIVLRVPLPDLQLSLFLAMESVESDEDFVTVEPVEVLQPQSTPISPVDGGDTTSGLNAVDRTWPEHRGINELPMSSSILVGGTMAHMPDDHFDGRGSGARARLVSQRGGTVASEAAVARGLVWLKNHQLADGSWSFRHRGKGCNCGSPGSMDQKQTAATSLALLAFLGSGQTHQEGDYQQEVDRGLSFLMERGGRTSLHAGGANSTAKGLLFCDPYCISDFYGHGLATIALSEAFAMTHDPQLRPSIITAIDYLVSTQGPDGGWRYSPGQPGDLSVVSWQLMALKSAQFSRVHVPPQVFDGVDRFLASTSARRGARYSYLPGTAVSQSMTSAGLLCRMYLNWKDDNGGLQAGVRYLDGRGPEKGNMYSNFYATQVMYHWGGPEWERWNERMREQLVSTQILAGHAKGSWNVADPFGDAGGRLYMTTLALMTLEVYYRHLPLHQQDRINHPLRAKPNNREVQ